MTVTIRVEAQVLPVPEAAAGQEDREVLDRVAAAVPKVAPEVHHRPVEQRRAVLPRLPQLRQEVADDLYRLALHGLQLLQFPRVAAVVGEVVVAFRHVDVLVAPVAPLVGEHEGGDPGLVGLERQRDHVQHQLDVVRV
ncbi:MAG TPA: hypothetical protein VMZ71_13250, partial [Gemmataceae bacterium]|nr:hypothetical protein [Gemmataceae bacterium]